MSKENSTKAVENQERKKRKYAVTPSVLARLEKSRKAATAARIAKGIETERVLGKFKTIHVPEVTLKKIDLHAKKLKKSRWKIIDEALNQFG